MAFLLGEEVGATVGYAVRGERRTSAATRIEVVTTGPLLRRLQHDPELPGTAAVLLDECHERQLDADLALAFAVEARSALRPDLRLLAMSATAATEPLAELLGGPGPPAPVITARSALHPVTSVWAPPPASVRPGDGVRVAPGLLDHIAATVRRALHEQEGDVLVFLPGAGESPGCAPALRPARHRLAPAARTPVRAGSRTPRCARRRTGASSSPQRSPKPASPFPVSASWSTPAWPASPGWTTAAGSAG